MMGCSLKNGTIVGLRVTLSVTGDMRGDRKSTMEHSPKALHRSTEFIRGGVR